MALSVVAASYLTTGCDGSSEPDNSTNHPLTLSATQVGQVFVNKAILNIKAEDQDGLKAITLTVDWQVLTVPVPADATQIDTNKTIENLSAGWAFDAEVVAKSNNPELQEEESKTVTTTIHTSQTQSNQPPTITIEANATDIYEWESVTLSATASDPDGAVSKIEWFDANGNLLWTGTSITDTPVLPSGSTSETFTYYAVATDDDGATKQSNHVTITVNEQAPVLDHVDVIAGNLVPIIDDLWNNTYKAWVDSDTAPWTVTITFSGNKWDESISVSAY